MLVFYQKQEYYNLGLGCSDKFISRGIFDTGSVWSRNPLAGENLSVSEL